MSAVGVGRPLYYVAHPFGGNPSNLIMARRWFRWLVDHDPHSAFVLSWIIYCEMLDDDNPAHRERGLQDNCAIAARCGGIVLVGGTISSGMRCELNAVIGACESPRIADLTRLGPRPPAAWDPVNTPTTRGRMWWEDPA